ncbi:MAG: serine hydrolase [Bryobacterales bacterium]|nr:serine hydrolase [Bryobacterales bacterium]
MHRTIALALTLAALPLAAQTGLEVAELAELESAVTAAMATHKVPGGALAVAYQGRLVMARGYGLADRDRTERVQPDSIFRVASVSKLISGIAAMKLVEQAKLRLDDAAFGVILSDYTPPAPLTKLAAYNQITTRQLLQHTAGFPVLNDDIVNGPFQREAARAFGVASGIPTVEQMIRWQLSRPPVRAPGQMYEYSNGGIVAAGRVMERAAGKPYERFVVEDVLAPLGIVRTRLASPQRRNAFPGEVRYHMPEGTARVQSVFPGEGLEDWPYAFNIAGYDAAGSWSSTAVDLARLVSRLNPLRPGSVLNAEAFAEMIRRPPAPVSQTGNTWYGAGIQVVDQGNGNYFLQHSGSLPGTNSLVMRYHPLDLTIVAVFNQRGADDESAVLINDATRGLSVAATNFVRSGRAWPAHDLFGQYLAVERPLATAAGVLNAASFRGGAVAPGEVITVFGERLSGGALTTARVENGRLATELGGTRVWFDGVAAPLVYTSAGQVSAIVPYSVAGKATTRMEVERLGVRSEAAVLNVAAAAPALFTSNASGSGPAAAQIFAAERVAVLYATGEGLTDPLPGDGELAVTQPLPKPRLPVKVLLAGREVPVLYAGAAPGLTAGVLQVNVQVPEDLAAQPGPLPLVLQVGEARSPDGVTLTLR